MSYPIRVLLALALMLASCGSPAGVSQPSAVQFLPSVPPDEPAPLVSPPDFSGLAWMEGDTFVAVHDAKATDEAAAPRVSLIELPGAEAPLRWTPLDVVWPDPEAPSHDLESIAHIPGTPTYLLVESGDDGTSFQRIFVADLRSTTLTVREAAGWPIPVHNVEGTAVARVGGDLYFVFAERAHGESETEILWARLSLAPFALGDVHAATFRSPTLNGPGVRPISTLSIDHRGRVYTASAFDPDVDGGPFRSTVWCVGTLEPDAEWGARLILAENPEHLATLDGMKVESLAARPAMGGTELVLGTDDEHFGGVLRPLPLVADTLRVAPER